MNEKRHAATGIGGIWFKGTVWYNAEYEIAKNERNRAVDGQEVRRRADRAVEGRVR